MDVPVGNMASTPIGGAWLKTVWRAPGDRAWTEWRRRTVRRLGLRLPKKRPGFWLRKMTAAQHEEIQQPGPVWGSLDPGAPWIPSSIDPVSDYWCSACRARHPESAHHRDTSIDMRVRWAHPRLNLCCEAGATNWPRQCPWHGTEP